MSIANYLVNLTDGLTSQGVLGSLKGGTGLTTVGSSGQAIVSDGTNWVSQTVASGAPKVSQISYTGDNTAANPTGGETVTLTGTGFAAGARVLINQTQVGVVTVVSATEITFTAPQLATGSYVLYVVNTDGGTAVVVPGIQYSGVPAWTTAAGTLGTVYETAAISSTVAATSDSAVSYSVISGALPSGATLASNGTISGTSPVTASSTTYSFTIRANDLENQETDRTFNLTINPDVVVWSTSNSIALQQNVASTTTLAATSAAGQTVSYATNTLPAGLTQSGATVSGTPTVAGTTITTATATAAVTGKTAQQTITWTVSIAADTYFPYTTLLLNSETTALPFLADASTNNFSLTAFGDTKPSNFNPYTPGYYSNYFDGSGDSLTAPASTAWNFTGDWTFECWINPNSITGFQTFLGQWGDTSSVFIWKMNSSGRMYLENLSTAITATSTTIVANQWQHIALTRSSNTIRMFVNGVLDATTATRSGTYYSSGLMRVGASGVNEPFAGYISNMRVINGTALYTAAFTPPTGPLTAVTNTSLLTCQANRFLDTSANAFAVTKAGDTKISSFVPFQTNSSYSTLGSTYFDGTGDYLSSTAVSITPGSSDFCLEAWGYWTSFNNGAYGSPLISIGGGSPGGQLMLRANKTSASSTSANYYSQINGTFIPSGGYSSGVSAGTIYLNTWTHLALTRQGSTFRLFVNGELVSTQTDSQNYYVTFSTLHIGSDSSPANGLMTGWVADARLVIGSAVYTAGFTPPATPLTAVSGTRLLTCQTNQPHNNQTFLDNSSSALPITRSGNATQGAFSPYGANWSNYFDGSSNSYIQTPASSNTAVLGASLSATSTFTVECWIYQTQRHTSTTAPCLIGDQGVNGSLYWTFGPDSTGKLAFYHYTGSQVLSTGNTTIPLNTWTHIAVSISSGAIKLFVNGTLQTITGATTTGSQAGGFGYLLAGGAGGFGTSSGYYGYVSNLRIVKSALYTTTFTPSTEPLTAVNNTGLLMCQSPSITDNSLNALALTAGNTLSTQKFNPFAVVTQTPVSHSVRFDGSGDYLTVPSSSNLAFGTGDFCVEMWYYQQANAVAALFSNAVNSGGGDTQFELQIASSTFYPTLLGWATTFLTSSVASTPNAWNHIAVCRSGTTLSMFLNGTRVATTTTSNNFSSTNAFHISRQAAAAAAYINGYISNLRVVKGSSVYTPSATTITVPTQPLTAIANTQLLTCQDATFKDNSTNQFAITAFDNATPRQQNPFGFTTSSSQDYSTSIFSGSTYFDGSGDGLTVAAGNSTLSLGTGNYTVEFWVNPALIGPSASSAATMVAIHDGSTDSGWQIFWNDGRLGIRTYYSNVMGWDASSTVMKAYENKWSHIAYVRSNGTQKIYLNGVEKCSTTGWNWTDTRLTVGYQAQDFNGYISDLRILKGQALYTANFAPPVAPLTAVTNTTFLLNADKAAIADKSGKVVLECVGDAKISTAVKKYGSSSMYFDGTGDYLTFPASAALAPRTGDFTIELWAYHLDTSVYATYFQQGNASGGIIIRRNNSNKLEVSHNSVVAVATSTANIQANQWTHIAVSRSGTTFRTFIDGVVASTVTYAGDFNDMTTHYIGTTQAIAGYYMNGYIDDLRITRGYARYTANFTPPTTLLTK